MIPVPTNPTTKPHHEYFLSYGDSIINTIQISIIIIYHFSIIVHLKKLPKLKKIKIPIIPIQRTNNYQYSMSATLAQIT